MVIYKYTNKINGKIYIGKTINFEKRKKDHLRFSINNYDNFPIHRAIRKYGIDNFDIDILDNCLSENELNEKEMFYINFYKSLISENEYNCSLGGDGQTGFKHGEEFKKSLKNRMLNNSYTKGIKLTDEHKLKISLSLKGKKRPQCGRKKTQEEKEHLSKKLKGRIFSEIHLYNKKESTKKTRDNRMFKFSNGLEIYEGTPYDFSKSYSLDRSSITKLINSKIKKYKKWYIL